MWAAARVGKGATGAMAGIPRRVANVRRLGGKALVVNWGPRVRYHPVEGTPPPKKKHTIDINQFIITDCHPEALFPAILTGPLDLSMDYNIFFREFNLTETAHNCRRNFTIFIVKFSGT